MSGLLGPVVAPGITPDSGQGQLATAISSFFGAGTPQFSTQAPQPAAPPTTYDKWGHVITGQAQPQAAPAAPAPTVPPQGMQGAAALGLPVGPPSGNDQWGKLALGDTGPSSAVGGPGLAASILAAQSGGVPSGLPTSGLLAQPATPGSSSITPGASGYDQWGRQAPVAPQAIPQLPGLADLLAMVQAAQARQQAPPALPTRDPTGNEGGQ